jgi:hypothetical protein
MASLIWGTAVNQRRFPARVRTFGRGHFHSCSSGQRESSGTVIYFTLRSECREDIGAARPEHAGGLMLDRATMDDRPTDQRSANMGLVRHSRLTVRFISTWSQFSL